MKGNGPNINELTRIEAYLLSEKAGHPSHMHDYFWTQAESIVRQRVAIVEVAKATGKNTAKATKGAAVKSVAGKAKKKTAEPKPEKSGTAKKAAPAARKPAAKSK